MKAVNPGTAMVSAFVVLVGLSAAYTVHRWTRTEDGPKSLETELAAPVGSSLRSPTPMPLPAHDRAEAASNDPGETQPSRPAPPEEDRNQPTLADAPSPVHRPPKSGRHVIYVQVEAELVPPGTESKGGDS